MAKTKQNKVTASKGRKTAPKAASAKPAARPVKKPVKKAMKKSVPPPKKSVAPKAAPQKAKPPKKAAPKAVAAVKLTPFLQKQRDKLLALRDSMLDSMAGVAKDNLRSRAEGSEASAFGMHQADAGSDAYDRDFALNLLSQEQNALYEIEAALERLENGTYGVCEMSGKTIPHPRLEAIPFTRYTVECQTQLEKQRKAIRVREPVTSLFGLSEEESASSGEGDEEESASGELKE